MIRAVTFDLDGVYFPNGKANFIKALRETGVSEDEAKGVFLKSDQMNVLYKTGKMSDGEFWSWAAGEWKVDKSPQELIDLLIAGYNVDERVVATIKKLRRSGYKALVCSNNFPARVNGLQARFKFLENFDASVFSYEVGETKPSPVIFSELVKRAGVPSETIVFSDDNPDNLLGAKTLGITTFLYDGFARFLGELRRLGVSLD